MAREPSGPPWPAGAASRSGLTRATRNPPRPAAAITRGKGAPNRNSARNASAATATISRVFRARRATRSKASITIARTAAFKPKMTAAKALVAGHCAIDMLAGPSECLVLADAAADADLIAADLLAQAEHDTDALPILVSTSAALVARVEAALGPALAALPTRDVAAVAMTKGFAVVCEGDLDAALAVVDVLAPEHLEIQVADADAVWRRVRNFGGMFVGPGTAEVFGDYGAGPNHVLPTSGTARYTGGLSVFTFLVSGG